MRETKLLTEILSSFAFACYSSHPGIGLLRRTVQG
jgi:hypothetical protein